MNRLHTQKLAVRVLPKAEKTVLVLAMSVTAPSPPSCHTTGNPARLHINPAGPILVPHIPPFPNYACADVGGDEGGVGMADADEADNHGEEDFSDLMACLRDAVLDIVAGRIEETLIGVSNMTSTHAVVGANSHPPGATWTAEEEGGELLSSLSSSFLPDELAGEGAEESRSMEPHVCRIVGMLRQMYPVLSVRAVSDRLAERQMRRGRGCGGEGGGYHGVAESARAGCSSGGDDHDDNGGSRGGGGRTGASRKRGLLTRAARIKADGTDAAMAASAPSTAPPTRKRARIASAASVSEAEDRGEPAETVVAGDGSTFGYRRVYESEEEGNGEYQKVYNGNGSGGNGKGEEKTGGVGQKDPEQPMQQQRKEKETTEDPPTPPPKLPRNRGGRPKGSGKGPYRARGSGILTPEEKYDKVRYEAKKVERHRVRFAFHIFS